MQHIVTGHLSTQTAWSSRFALPPTLPPLQYWLASSACVFWIIPSAFKRTKYPCAGITAIYPAVMDSLASKRGHFLLFFFHKGKALFLFLAEIRFSQAYGYNSDV
jgi:hypothetical protein